VKKKLLARQSAVEAAASVEKQNAMLLSHNLLGKQRTLSTATHSADGDSTLRTKKKRGISVIRT
jgi:hypothetical protein